MYDHTIRKAHQIRRFTIVHTNPEGWEVRLEHDSQLIRSSHYTDWHRVERARMMFARDAMLLEEAGWTDYSTKR
jgi:hypothetical protein